MVRGINLFQGKSVRIINAVYENGHFAISLFNRHRNTSLSISSVERGARSLCSRTAHAQYTKHYHYVHCVSVSSLDTCIVFDAEDRKRKIVEGRGEAGRKVEEIFIAWSRRVSPTRFKYRSLSNVCHIMTEKTNEIVHKFEKK